MAASMVLGQAGQGCLPDAPHALSAYVPIPPPGYAGIQAIRTFVAWGDVKHERSYTVERAVWTVNGWSAYQLLAVLPANVTSYTDFQPVAPCIYRVSAVNQCGAASSVFVFDP